MRYNHLITLIILLPTALCAQKKLEVPLVLSVFHQSLSLPTHKMGVKKPFHLGFKLGTEISIRQRERSGVFQAIELRYYYHKTLYHNLSISTSFGYRGKIKDVFLDMALGAGYSLQVLDQKTFQPDGNGNFTEKKSSLSRFLTALSFGAGYNLPGNHRLKNIYTRYEIIGNSPFNKEVFVVPTTMLHIGTSIKTSN